MRASKLIPALLVATGAFSAAQVLVDPATPPDSGPKGSTLVFSDEFDGERLDLSKWNIGTNRKNIHYNKNLACVYSSNNVALRDGKMVFTARPEPQGATGPAADGTITRPYSSGAVNTDDIFYFGQNMYIELRIKLPLNDGGYAALWSMPRPEQSVKEDPRERVQVLFFEYIAAERKRKFWSTLRFNSYIDSELRPRMKAGKDYIKIRKNHNFIINPDREGVWMGDSFRLPMFEWYEWFEWTGFVTVGFMATPEKFQWFVVQDGPAWKTAPYLTFTGSAVRSAAQSHVWAKDDVWQRPVPQRMENRIILSHSLRDAERAGGPIDVSQLPSEMLVDYIRIYQLPTSEPSGN